MIFRWAVFYFSAFFSFLVFSLSPYEILGIKETATDEEIKKAYLKRAKEVHPDSSGLPKEQALAEFKAVQSAWEQLTKARKAETLEDRYARAAERRQMSEKLSARDEAAKWLEAQWSQGKFSANTIRELPRFKASQRQPLFGLEPNRSPKDDGEWEAIEDFFRRHQSEYLENNPSASELHQLLTALDNYKNLTGRFVQSVKKGLTEPFENAFFERAHDKGMFLQAITDKLERMAKAGVFLNSTNPASEREKTLRRPSQLFAERFGDPLSNPVHQLAQAVLEKTFSEVEGNITKLHEMGSLIRGFAPALPPEESLQFLGNLLEKLEGLPSRYQLKSDLRELKARATTEVARVFEKNPNLKKLYLDKTSFWKRFSENLPVCDLILGKIARKLD